MTSRKALLRKTICMILTFSLVGTGCFSLTVRRNGWKRAAAAWETTILLVPRAERSLILIDESRQICTEQIYDLVENQQMFSEDAFENILESRDWDELEEAQWELLLRRSQLQQQLETMYGERERAQGAAYEQYLEEQRLAEEALKKEQAAKEKAAKEKAEKQKAEEEKKASQSAGSVYCVVNYRGERSVSVSKEDYQCLLRIVQAEAGGEDACGKRLVTNVILNRVVSGEFPNTVVGVVFQKGQFSPIRNGAYDRAKVSESTRSAVDEVLAKGVDEANGALYFFARRYTSAEKAAWFDTALTKVAEHGVHEFYK